MWSVLKKERERNDGESTYAVYYRSKVIACRGGTQLGVADRKDDSECSGKTEIYPWL